MFELRVTFPFTVYWQSVDDYICDEVGCPADHAGTNFKLNIRELCWNFQSFNLATSMRKNLERAGFHATVREL